MSVYETELRRRLASGEDIETTEEWFAERVAETPNAGSHLSEFEFEFFMGIREAFTRWRGVN